MSGTTVHLSFFVNFTCETDFPFYYGNWSEQTGDAAIVLAIVFVVLVVRVVLAMALGYESFINE